MFVKEETGDANKVVASSQKTIAQAIRESVAPVKLSRSRIGDQLKIFLSRLPINPPRALPIPIQINNVAALNSVRVNEEVVEAPITMSMSDLPSHAPNAKPSSENTLTNKPRRHPETRINTASASNIKSR